MDEESRRLTNKTIGQIRTDEKINRCLVWCFAR